MQEVQVELAVPVRQEQMGQQDQQVIQEQEEILDPAPQQVIQVVLHLILGLVLLEIPEMQDQIHYPQQIVTLLLINDNLYLLQ